MKAYKLLSQKLRSRGGTQWELNVPITITKEGNEMCTDQVLHYYNHPGLAIFLNPAHAKIYNPRMFEIEIDKQVNTDGLKFASKSQTLIREIIDIPVITIEQCIEIAIRSAKTVVKDKTWNIWADRWLSGEDRTKDSAHTTYTTCHAASAAYTATVAAYTAFTDTDIGYTAAFTTAYTVWMAHSTSTPVVGVMDFNRTIIDIVEHVVGKQLQSKYDRIKR